MPKVDANPMQRAHAARRCSARSKRTGLPCRAPAVRGWSVCRMHGARGGAPEGDANGAFRHGLKTLEAAAWRQDIQDLLRGAWAAVERVGHGP